MEESPVWGGGRHSSESVSGPQHPHLCRRLCLAEADRFEEAAVHLLMKLIGVQLPPPLPLTRSGLLNPVCLRPCWQGHDIVFPGGAS